jgi:hypothetical protein
MYDFVLDDTDNMKIDSTIGDFAIEQSDDLHIESILLAKPGQYYEYSLLGYGIQDKLNGPFTKQIEKKAIRQALRRDDYNTTDLVISDGPSIVVDAVKTK